MSKIKVLIVDDSAVVRQVMSEILGKDAEIEIIGTAADPLFALDRLKRGPWPDVITLDVEMPRMDGITFLRQLMQEHPTPVVVCSSLTERGAELTMQVLAAGAVAVLTKPTMGVKDFLHDSNTHLLEVVKGASKANRNCLGASPIRTTGLAKAPQSPVNLGRTTEHIVAIGTSTGGTQALERVLVELPLTTPGIVVVQHMPAQFTAQFAARLNDICAMEVLEAKDGDRVIPGRVLIAPGGRHMSLVRNGAQYTVHVFDAPVVNRHRPSVDVLLRSVAKAAGRNAMGIIMTGMGDDGARGLKEMRDAGANTLAQDEASSVVFGMPKEAIRLGGAASVVSLGDISGQIKAYTH